MNTITINLPNGIKATPELIERINLAVKPDIAESHAILICQREFGQSFKVASYNTKGFDVVSEDGTIIVEVKQTSKPHSKAHVLLQANSTWPKYGICTHMLILDYYNVKNRCSIIPHDEFFASKFHGPTKTWRWDIDYGTRMSENTNLFKKYEVQI